MPVKIDKENLVKLLSVFLKQNESIIAVLVTSSVNRCVIGLTDQKRLLIISVPLLGKPNLLEEISVSEIEYIDFFLNENSISFLLKSMGVKKIYKLPLSNSSFFIGEELKTFIFNIFKINSAASPGYLDKNEKIIEALKTKNDIFKLTDKNIFLFKRPAKEENNWIVDEKIQIDSLQEFDYYPEKKDSLLLYIENEECESRKFKITSKAIFLSNVKIVRNTDDIIENIYESFSGSKHLPVPSYIFDEEKVLTTMRAANNISGLSQAGIILRLTDKRLLDLLPDVQGKLSVNSEILIDEIKKIRIEKERATSGARAKFFVIYILTEDGKKQKYWVSNEYLYAINKFYNKFEGYDIYDEPD